MNIESVIQHLRANLAPVAKRVAGAAAFARALDGEVMMDLPAAYVTPGEEEADENPVGNGLEQHVVERISLTVEFDNTFDRRGQAPVEQYEAMRQAVWACLLNWRVDPVNSAQGLFYEGGRLIDFDRARLFYQWTFGLRRLLTDADGWQEPVDDLVEAQISTASPSRPTSPGLDIQALDTLAVQPAPCTPQEG